ncbi:MAG TPA: ATP synthase F1 subunit epsilon [Candidatus Aphodoplasma excrementigallinarum]|uniref:ATP synthase epsilon chain n=1 Tax=Candidatus Aphodoplasma excrementigallinarum TaxID=2840673 RepID=A0A9D1NH85_9FIRM|nr:ATP synthase F1 subunit epsilon [Candidatus Aphodoplasma excrementigallinarum]
MAKTFQLDIVASDRKFFSGSCEMLVFPALDGECGILPGHESMVTCLAAGELRYLVDGTWHYAAVSDGFVEIMPTFVVLLADTVERPDEIDVKRANEAKIRAEERMRQKQSIREYYHTQAALNRAMNRLKVTGRHK